ncbi:hypothetical protein C8Q75DRAFT_590438 [Abortiporus biennis]|nr:hypothetical protein C8Q75DRAFT_590438 [Abortiporus biennis]
MALQTSSGVNPTITITGGQTTSTSDSSNGTSNPGSNITPGSSIPFSFLIAFIALFLFFLGCGLGTRRVAFVIRRSLGLPIQDVDTRRPRKSHLIKPILWDIYPRIVEEGKSIEDKWVSLHPLSATFLREKQPEEEHHHRTLFMHHRTVIPTTLPTINEQPTIPNSPTSPTTPRPVNSGLVYPSRYLGRSLGAPTPSLARSNERPSNAANPPLPHEPLSLRIRRYLHSNTYTGGILEDIGFRPPPLSGNISSKDSDVPAVEALQLSILIAMPSPERSHFRKLKQKVQMEEFATSGQGKGKEVWMEKRSSEPSRDHEEEGLGEFVLATSNVSWTKEEGNDIGHSSVRTDKR